MLMRALMVVKSSGSALVRTYSESRHLGHSSGSLVGLGLLSVDVASEESSREGRDSVNLHDESGDKVAPWRTGSSRRHQSRGACKRGIGREDRTQSQQRPRSMRGFPALEERKVSKRLEEKKPGGR
jgi:hypothetical protein